MYILFPSDINIVVENRFTDDYIKLYHLESFSVPSYVSSGLHRHGCLHLALSFILSNKFQLEGDLAEHEWDPTTSTIQPHINQTLDWCWLSPETWSVSVFPKTKSSFSLTPTFFLIFFLLYNKNMTLTWESEYKLFQDNTTFLLAIITHLILDTASFF